MNVLKTVGLQSDPVELTNNNPPSQFTDKDDLYIWRSFKSGDESAFVFIYQSYYPILTNFGYQICKNKDLITDCIQDLFIDIYTRRSKLSDARSIKTYLLVSLRRKLLKYLEMERKDYSNHHAAARETFKIQLSHEDLLINRKLSREQKEKLQTAISKLSGREREALYYFYYQDLTYREITEIFKYSQVKTSRNLVYQALNKLRKLMMSVVLFFLTIG